MIVFFIPDIYSSVFIFFQFHISYTVQKGYIIEMIASAPGLFLVWTANGFNIYAL